MTNDQHVRDVGRHGSYPGQNLNIHFVQFCLFEDFLFAMIDYVLSEERCIFGTGFQNT